ncbi:MAG: aspartate aminotransferase family protein [Candidatus Omnitrophota bacterium]|jgi:acetylornithine/N-succinyldiaminopimelate aminotransferase
MNAEEIFQSYRDNVLNTYTKTPLIIVKGKGSYVWDIHGKKYLDFFPGWGVGSLGHCHQKVVSAIKDQVGKLIFVPNSYYNVPQAVLAHELSRLSGAAFKAFFCNSGAEANEGAIKLSRKFGNGRYEIITFENSFHGRTLAALSATGQKKYQQGFAPLVQAFKTVKFNDLEAVKRAVNEKTVAVMLELIQGEGGINIAGKEFVQGLRRLCDEKKFLLIVDEVQTGFGRTGKMFAWQDFGIVPDVFTLAKALGGGLPIGVMMVKNDFSGLLTPGTHASTFGGGPVVCRAALAVLRAIQKERLLYHAGEMGRYLYEKLKELQEGNPLVIGIRGSGLMWGVQLQREGKSVVEECLKRGLLINCTHDTVLRIMPSLKVSTSEINKAVKILKRALEKCVSV